MGKYTSLFRYGGLDIFVVQTDNENGKNEINKLDGNFPFSI